MVATISRLTSSHGKNNPVLRTSGPCIDFTANAFNASESRRTRKRISAVQLAHLEELYRQSSHPTRDERDALAKRIEMETRSVTIWFQNKRQTDRKVALHNATNSRNIVPTSAASGPPNITLTTPTSPAYALDAAVSLSTVGSVRRHSHDGMTRRSPATRSTTLKRSPSLVSSITSTSTTNTSSTSKSRPSLDRVASRSEIRFAHRPSVAKSNISAPITKSSGMSSSRHSTVSVARTRTDVSCTSRSTTRIGTFPPGSPPSSASPPLWATMLSSPLAPSSPPPPEYVSYTRARKARTLDWACASARLASGVGEPVLGSREDSSFSGKSMYSLDGISFASGRGPVPTLLHGPNTQLRPTSPYPRGALIHRYEEAAVAKYEEATTLGDEETTSTREYEEGTVITEDEAELITPHGSQDWSMPWTDNQDKTGTQSPFTKVNPAVVDSMDATDSTSANGSGWAEDEMHAAVALCGLRG